MKRYLAVLLALALCLSAAGCKQKPVDETPGTDGPSAPPPSGPAEPDPGHDVGDDDDGDEPVIPTGVTLGVLRDSAALGAAGLAAGGRYEVRVGGDDILSGLSDGTLDAAIIPVGSAAKLYNETDGKVRIAAVTASGGWVLVERGDSVQDILGLVNRTVYLPNGYDTASRIFEYVTGEYGYIIGDTLDVRYVDEGALSDVELALMPSMMAGSTIVQDSGARIALDLQELWTYLTEEPFLPAACLAVSDGLSDGELQALLTDLEESQKDVSDWLDAAVAAGMASSQEEAWAALEGCKLVWIQGATPVREALARYLSALYTLDPSLIGGYIPDDGFYR